MSNRAGSIPWRWWARRRLCHEALWVTVLLVAACNTGDLSTTPNGGSPSAPPAPNPVSYTLSVSVSGSGTVTSSAGGIGCPGDCTQSYVSGTAVTLTATPSSGYQFDGFGGDCSGSSCTLTMTAARSVTATFGVVSTADTRYVDPSGIDTNPGTQAQPWRTLARAAQGLNSGEARVVLVNDGQYSGGMHLTRGGSATLPVVLRANGNSVIIDGSTRSDGAGIYVDGFPSSPAFNNTIDTNGAFGYVQIEGFTIRNMPGYGVRVSWAHHVTLRNNTVSNTLGEGVFTDFSDRPTFEGNEVSGAGTPSDGCAAGFQKHGIYHSNSGNYPTFRTNRLHDNCGNGIHMNGDVSVGYGGDGVISGALIERNQIANNNLGGDGAGISLDGGDNAVIQNNLLYGNRLAGIAIYQIDGGGPSINNRVVNNTIHVPAGGRWAIAMRDGATGNTVRNNILLSDNGATGAIEIAADSRSGFVSDYNVVVDRLSADDGNTALTLAQWQALGYDANSRIATAAQLFTVGGYRLLANSPARDSGNSQGAPAIDLDGVARPQGAVYDIGAYEYVDSATTSFAFLAYGDSRAGRDCAGNAVHLSLVSRMVSESADFMFHLGDMVTGYNRNTNWVQNGDCTGATNFGSFKNLIAPLQAKAPAPGLPTFYFPVVGNHDDSWGSSWYPDAFGGGFCDVFNPTPLVPNHTQQPYFTGRGGVTRYSDADFYRLACTKTRNDVYSNYIYYSFNYKNAHFVILRLNDDYHDLEVCNSCGPDRGNYGDYYNIHQLDWLRTDLAAASINPAVQHIFVFLHAPLFTTSQGHSANVSWPVLSKLFSQYRVRAVLSGHNHVYERSVPIFASAANPNGVRDDANGTVYVVTGGGGSDFHGFNANQWFIAQRAEEYHYLKIVVSGATASVQAIKPDGAVFDSFAR